MMNPILLWSLTVGLIALCGIFYRLGGAAKAKKWYDFLCNTKTRDLGCPVCVFALLCLHEGVDFHIWWAYLVSFGLLFGSMTTYWKKKGTDAKWYNWLFVGLGMALAMLPFALAAGDMVGFWIRLVLLPLLIMGWSELISNAVVEEIGRGVILAASTLLFLILKRKKK